MRATARSRPFACVPELRLRDAPKPGGRRCGRTRAGRPVRGAGLSRSGPVLGKTNPEREHRPSRGAGCSRSGPVLGKTNPEREHRPGRDAGCSLMGPVPGATSPAHERRPGFGAGFSLVEVAVVLLLLGVWAAMALPSMRTGLDGLRAAAAARHLAALVQSTRVRAVMRSVPVGLRFEREDARYRYATYADGDGDGLRTGDVRSGRDPRLTPFERIGDRFPGVTLGIAETVPGVSGRDTLAAGSDPIRFGASDTLTFSPLGTATSGTLYLRDRSGRQLAVRVLGATGRTRILEFSEATESWAPR